jgi:16S rRNA processing protein RimM
MTSNARKPDDALILLGVIVNAHGIKGDVLVRSFADVPKDIAAYGPLTSNDGTQAIKLTVKRDSKKGLICRVAGVDNRNQAEALRGTELFIARDRLPTPEEGAFYFADLIGLQAIAPDGTRLGTITNVMNHGASDILELKLCDSAEIEMVPFLDDFVPSIDIQAGTITIVLPETAPDET